MPITLLRNSGLLAAAVVAAGFLAASPTARAESVSFRLPDLAVFTIAAEAGHVRARAMPRSDASSSRGEAVAVDRRLAAELLRAAQLVAVAGRGFSEGGRTFVVLGAAIPSVAKPGSGYCGAGAEDDLLVVEYKARPRRLERRDRVQVQSCLRSMALQSDQGSDLRVVLRGVDDPAKFSLTWLEHPTYDPATKTLIVDNGKFVVLP